MLMFFLFHFSPVRSAITFLTSTYLIVVQVPKEWKLDPNWDAEPKQHLSHQRKFPSKWRATSSQQDPVSAVRIIDHFVIQQTQKEN